MDNTIGSGVALVGVAILAAGGVSSTAEAATVEQTKDFSVDYASPSLDIDYLSFDTSLGTLTGVEMDLNSFFSTESASATATILFGSETIASKTSNLVGTWIFSDLDILAPNTALTTADFEGDGVSKVTFTVTYAGNELWNAYAHYGQGLTLRYIYDDAPEVPLPAGLPLLIGGLGALGLAAKRKTTKSLE